MNEGQRKCLLSVLPSAKGEPTFFERIMRWADFINGNKIKEDYTTIIFLSSKYSEENYGEYLKEFDIVRFFDEDSYWNLHRNDITVDKFFAPIQDELVSFNVSILFFARNEIHIGNFFPQARPFHFEQGIFSRGVMPWLTQFDPCGLEELSSLSKLSAIEVEPEIERQIIAILEMVRMAFHKKIAVMSENLSIDLQNFIKSSSKLYLTACPTFSIGVNKSLFGRDISIDDFLDVCASIVPQGAELVVTQHPGSVERVPRNLVKEIRSRRIFLVGDQDDVRTSALFGLASSVIVAHSMVGAQAKVAGKKLICHRDSSLAVLADIVFFIDEIGPKIVERTPTTGLSTDVIIAYMLSFLHMPREFWYGGYGRVYLEHFVSGKNVLELGKNKECQKFLPDLYRYYESILE